MTSMTNATGENEQTPVWEVLDTLERQYSRLEEGIAQLTSRILPLRFTSPSDAPEQPKGSERLCPLAQRINVYVKKIEVLGDLVYETIDELQI